MATLLYKLPSNIKISCDGIGEVKVGDEFKFIPDLTKNPSWPDRVKLTLKQIISDPAAITATGFSSADRIYTFEIDSTIFAVGTGQQTVDSCTFSETMLCWECCDDIEPRVDTLEQQIATLAARVTALENA